MTYSFIGANFTFSFKWGVLTIVYEGRVSFIGRACKTQNCLWKPQTFWSELEKLPPSQNTIFTIDLQPKSEQFCHTFKKFFHAFFLSSSPLLFWFLSPRLVLPILYFHIDGIIPSFVSDFFLTAFFKHFLRNGGWRGERW